MKKLILSIVSVFIVSFNLSAQIIDGAIEKYPIKEEQTVSVILTGCDTIDNAIKSLMKLHWKKCKYECVSLIEIANREKLGDYYLLIFNGGGVNSGGYSTSYSTTEFGKCNDNGNFTKFCVKYRKNKNATEFIREFAKPRLVSVFLDPDLFRYDYSNTAQPENGIEKSIFQKELINAILLNIKTVHWLISADLKAYLGGKSGTGENMFYASKKYNSNSCDLNKYTLLVSSVDDIQSKAISYNKKFDLQEFKQHYFGEVEFASSEKIKNYINNEKDDKHCVLMYGIYGRTPYCFIFRVSDGAVMFGCCTENAVQPGYTGRMYKQFDKICDK